MHRSKQHVTRLRPPSRLRLRVLGIKPDEVSFERRGFALVAGPRARLEEVSRTFVCGYRAALADDDAQAIELALAAIDDELRGFAYEGAAMGVALRDMLAPWRSSRLEQLLAGSGRAHVYMVHVGAGWALARMRRDPRATLRLNPLLRWLALDGFGFHQGYFQPLRHIDGCARQRGFSGYAARAFDQGLGRSLWFVTAAQPERIVQAIDGFEDSRHPDLWSGVALAAAYAGAAGPRTLERLAAGGAPFRSHLAQGAAFAAAAREHAGNPAAHTELACRTLAGLPSREAAKLTDDAALNLPPDGEEPAYEIWRSRLRTVIAEATLDRNRTQGPHS